MSPEEIEFARAEFERIFIGDDRLMSLCRQHARTFLPDGAKAAPTISRMIIESLRKKRPLSLLRVGNGEGNAIGMTKKAFRPLHAATFYGEFVSQNGMVIPEGAAVDLCGEVRFALKSADIIGFRSFRVEEETIIPNRIQQGNADAALGFLYAREFLQQGLVAGYWREATITSAWIHLDLVPSLPEILDAAESIIVVTGRSQLKEAMESRAARRLDEFITVPVQGFMPPSPEQSHFYSAFPDVKKRLNRELRGKLVLVGAGLFGKVYCHIAKQSGAIALDLGSAFDVLAGLETRPVHKEYDLAGMRWI